MAEDQFDVRAVPAADLPGVGDWQFFDEDIIGHLVFDISNDRTKEHYPYPTSVSLAEPDAFPHAEKKSTYSLDPDRPPLPSSSSFGETSSKEAKIPILYETIATRKAPGPLPRGRIECEWPSCDVSCSRRTDLRRHTTNAHLSAHSYKCAVKGCSKTFRRRDKLRAHEQNSHDPEVHLAKKTVKTVIPQTQFDDGSLGSTYEDYDSNGASNCHSFWMPLDEQVCQVLDNDTTTSTPATEYSYGPSEGFSTLSDEIFRTGIISNRSTSANRNVWNKTQSQIISANRAEEIESTKLKLACPYRKQNPVKYSIHSHTTCAMSCWDSATRVKEHLLRHHIAPIQCQRCWACFNTEDDLCIHISASNVCEPRPGSSAEGISPAVEMHLRTRKRRDQPEAKKWEEIYRILFPGEKETPTPYFVPIGDDAAAREQYPSPEKSFPLRTFGLGLAGMDVPRTQPSELISRIPPKTSLREELPLLFRLRLDRALDRQGAPALDSKQRSEIVSIAAECYDDLLARDHIKPSSGEEVRTPPAGYTLQAESMASYSNPNMEMSYFLEGIE